jgi:hypothetical protein
VGWGGVRVSFCVAVTRADPLQASLSRFPTRSPPLRRAGAAPSLCLSCREKWGLYGGVTTGTVLSFLCALLHYLGCLMDASAWGGHGRYIVVLVGQCIGAFAQPFFVVSPSKLAGHWFPVKEREIATTVASMMNPIGV